jgi:C-3',4' desaturase CrtD
MSEKIWDYIVIGAGLGGLMSAALIKARFPDRSLLILESHTDVGGCAGCFERTIKLPGFEAKQRVRFDVGATTLSALGEGQSLQRLITELGIALPTTQAEPGLRVVLNDGTVITRHANHKRWYDESARHFGAESIKLWQKLEAIESASWKLLTHFPRFPPASIRDIASLIKPQSMLGLSALRNMHRPFENMLGELGLSRDEKLRTFLDQLLLVSTQTTSDRVSTLAAALGLIYPSQTYYLDGGTYTLSSELLKRFMQSGGEIRFKQRVERIDPKTLTVTTSRGSFAARNVISNAPLWNTASMLGNPMHNYFHKWDAAIEGDDIWGANAYYAVVDHSIGRSALFHQLHDDASSMFVSLSRIGDTLKAPAGYRTLSVSTHEADPARWFKYSEEEYLARKAELRSWFERVMTEKLEAFESGKVHSVLVSTPRSFEFYTKRKLGLVGGLAYKAGRLPWHWPSPVSPINGLFLVGDTIFPGQSAGAVAQCALSMASRL